MKIDIIGIKTLVTLSLILVLTACIHPQMPLTSKESLDISLLTETKSIPEIHHAMKQGKISSEQLVKYYLDRIEQENPKLNAVISTNPQALKQAVLLDKEFQAGQIRGPLHGLPIIVKDNIETKEMPTTAGSLALADNHTYRDAPLIKNLKKAGAIILGKANLSEWANFRSTRSSSGWSAVGGQTKNPIDPTRSTCGSSSGSGAVVAANLAIAAVGTETDGSIVCPSSANGIVGIKPTVGLVSRSLVVPISQTQDTAGPMAKSVIDAAILLAAMQGKDDTDSATSNYAFKFENNYSNALSSLQTKGMKVGVLHSPAMNHELVKAAFSNFTEKLESAGAIINDKIKTEPYDGMFNDEFSLLMFEFKHDLNSYLKALPNEKNQLTLEKLIAFNMENKEKEMPYFQQEIFLMSQEKDSLKSEEYLKIKNNLKKATQKNGLDKIYQEHNLDVVISVTLGPSWKIDKVNGDHYTGGISSYSAISGYPHITIPLDKVHGLPVGLSLMGRATEEEKLIQLAYTFEQLIEVEK